MKQQAFGGWGKTLFALFERYKFVLLVILAGAALLLLPSPKEEEGQPPKPRNPAFPPRARRRFPPRPRRSRSRPGAFRWRTWSAAWRRPCPR